MSLESFDGGDTKKQSVIIKGKWQFSPNNSNNDFLTLFFSICNTGKQEINRQNIANSKTSCGEYFISGKKIQLDRK